MAQDEAGDRPRDPRVKTRDDDARGTPPGTGTIRPAHGGRIGNPRFEPTQAQRDKARTLAKTMRAELPMAKKWIANQLGVSLSTLNQHFAAELEAGRAEVVAALGAKLIGVALGTVKDVPREQLDAIKYALARIGGWSTKVEMGGTDGRPIEVADLSNLTPEQLEQYGRLAAAAEGQEFDGDGSAE